MEFGSLTLTNSLLGGNTAPQGPDLRIFGEHIAVRYSVIQDGTESGLVNGVDGNLVGVDPQLAPLTNNGGVTETCSLLAGSPAIDAGDPDFALPPEFDQRGNSRVTDGDADGVPRIDMGAFELLRGDVNGDGEVNGLDVDPFVDVLLNGPSSATADMNADGSVNGLDVDSFVTTVVGGGNAAGVASLSHLQEDFATEIGWPGVPLDRASMSPTAERSSARLSRARDVHDGADHSRLMHHRAVEQVMSRRLRLGRNWHRSPQKEVVHEVAADWQATVDRIFGDGADWTG
jgi:hypothetical protein